MSISTRTGDDGKTFICSGLRIPKNDDRFHALGALDELNALLGTVEARVFDLTAVQHELFDLGCFLADLKHINKKNFKPPLERLDKEIADLESQLPPIHNFILPGGHPCAAQVHLARAVCRRAEREMLSLDLPQSVFSYMNRLSDYLFLVARKINFDEDFTEPLWKSVL